MEVSHPRFNTTEKTKTSKIRNIGASFPALGANNAFLATSLPAGIVVLKKLHKMGNLPDDKIELLHKKANDAIKLAGLDKYGVKIKHIKESTVKKPLIKLILNPMEMIEQGLNAAFLGRSAGCFKKNTILMPQKGVSFLAFHEIGHALNHNLSKIGKSLQYLGIPGMIAAVAIGLFGAVTKTSKPQDGKELTGWQKFKNFVRDNAGKLSFAAMLPMLTEEAMATIKGQKLAKKLLSPEMSKTVLKGNSIAYLSYLASAIAVGLGSMAAVKVKDYFAESKANK